MFISDLLNQNAGQTVGNVHTAKVPEVKQAEALVPGPVGTRRSSPPRRAVADLLWWRDSRSGPVMALFEKTNIKINDFRKENGSRQGDFALCCLVRVY